MKVLLIRFSSAGDILISGELIKRLKSGGHKVHFLTKEKFREAAFAAGAERIYSPKINAPGDYFTAAAVLKAEDYGAIVDLHGTLRSVLMTVLTKAGKKVFYSKDIFKRRLMAAFKWFLGKKTESIYSRYISAAMKAVGKLDTAGKKAKHVKKIKNIIVHTGAKWSLKRWPYFEELVKGLSKTGKYRITVTGVKDEVENYREMVYDKCRNINDLTGKTSFKRLLEEIKKADLFVGNDTAAAHAAKLYGVPAVILLGPTVQDFGFITGQDFKVVENVSLLCRPCHVHGGEKCKTGGFECMRSLKPQLVINEIKKISKKSGA